MEYDEHKELIPRDNEHSEITTGHRLRAVQVPPSLLPMVLLRLGLSSDAPAPEISVDTLVDLLHSERWEERLNAVRMLGRLGSGVPVDLLTTALEDPDGSVRAAAIFALGTAGRHAPLHRLVSALYDTDWHVRETAVLALSKQGQRVPQEVLQIALHDADSSVREAAFLALQQHASTSVESESEYPAAYEGQLWEQQIMQQKEGHHNGSADSSRDEGWSDTFVAYNRDARGLTRVLREQQQAYAAKGPGPDEQWQSYTAQISSESASGGQMQMFAPLPETLSSEQANEERRQDPIEELPLHEEYGEVASSAQGEKVTSFQRPRRSSKGWWILIAVVALLFFLLGGVVTKTSTVPVLPDISIGHSEKAIQAFPQDDRGIPFEKQLLTSQSLVQTRQQIADGLHLSPDAITQQLQSGETMQDIASSQNMDPNQLHNIELKAITSLIDSEVNAGNINQDAANALLNRLQKNPDTLDKLTALLFTGPIAIETGAQSAGAGQIFSDPKLSMQAQSQIASALHLLPQDITAQLQSGKSLSDIATAQGVSNDQLHSIELKTYNSVANAAVKNGNITQNDANVWLKDLSNSPDDLDKTTQNLFLNNIQQPIS